MGDLRELVGFACSWVNAVEEEVAGVGGNHFLVVGQGNGDARGGCEFICARALHGKKMAGASGVSYGVVGWWGTTTGVLFNWGVTRDYGTSVV